MNELKEVSKQDFEDYVNKQNDLQPLIGSMCLITEPPHYRVQNSITGEYIAQSIEDKYFIKTDSAKKMELNDIKKALYKERPVAKLLPDSDFESSVGGQVFTYWSEVLGITVRFVVPISDMGDAKFEDHMPAHLLIRWIQL